MTFRGFIKNGEVVVTGAERLPEGAAVRIDVVKPVARRVGKSKKSLLAKLGPVVGSAKGLPRDYAAKHDEYARRRKSR
ncbi:MAG: hypothetical protein K2Y21_07135 [Phycisphaerales bacterium]|nr:hypothetical protein [Phycisphaerales bacterium]